MVRPRPSGYLYYYGESCVHQCNYWIFFSFGALFASGCLALRQHLLCAGADMQMHLAIENYSTFMKDNLPTDLILKA